MRSRQSVTGSQASSGAERQSEKSKDSKQAPDAAVAPKTVAQVLGEIVWLMTQSPRHKTMPIADLEWMVMPAILLKQFRTFYERGQPVGTAFWAVVDDVVFSRIEAGEKRLSPAEWRSGERWILLDVIAPFGAEQQIRAQLGKGSSS